MAETKAGYASSRCANPPPLALERDIETEREKEGKWERGRER